MSEIKRFGRFEVQGVLGRGGMGTVHLARDPLIDRRVAIKEIRIDPSDDERERAELEERFKLEFRSAGKLAHPNIVTIYDVGQGGGSYFIAMEYVAGMSLAAYLKETPKPPFDWISRLATQVASGLDYAHQHDIVHRDIKPGNVLLSRDHRPMITDFGLVKVLTSDLTMTGTVLGTPAFMSPEQVMGSDTIDGASDQFSFAVILYLMLTGDQPFAGEHPSTILYKIVHEPPARPQTVNAKLPPAVDQVLLRALAKKPEDRYPDCSTLAAELASALAEERTAILDRPQATPGADAPSPEKDPAPKNPAVTSPRIARPASSSSGPADYSYADMPTPTPRTASRGAAMRGGASRGAAMRGAAMRRSSGATRWIGAAGFLVAMALLGYFASTTVRRWQGGGGATGIEPAAAAAAEAIRPRVEHTLRVEAGPPGATIRVDGRDTGLTVPADVALSGTEGETRRVEVVAGDAVLASRDVRLTAETPASWTTPPAEITLAVTSQPEGATIRVDDRDTGLTTPAEMAFSREGRHSLVLTLPGYDSAGWTFGVDELSETQLDCSCLHFPLTSSVPPGFVTISAPYPVTLTIGGKRHGPLASGEVAVEPGARTVLVVAEEVFLRQTYRVDVDSGDRVPIRVPQAVAVRIRANPANCRVSINGIDVDVTPINRRIAIGSHEFTFHWPALGKTKTVRKAVTKPGQRISETSN